MEVNMQKFFGIILFVFIFFLFMSQTYAQVSLSGGNLGYTSFMDGFDGILYKNVLASFTHIYDNIDDSFFTSWINRINLYSNR